MAAKLKWVNVALRAIMEGGIVLAFAYWGYQTSSSLLGRILLAIGAPLLVFGFWSIVDFHQAGRIAEPLRLVQELLISGLAAVALAAAGQPALGWALAILSIIHHVLVYALGGTLLKY